MRSALVETTLQIIRLCVIRKKDYCMAQQLGHKLKYVFALKPDANYKAHEEYIRSGV